MPNIIDCVAVTGSYVLVLHTRESMSQVVGRLGIVTFRPGWYLYVGSAFGPGGLVARLCRHMRREKVRRWHIDSLTGLAEFDSIWVLPWRRAECQWAEHLLEVLPHAVRVGRGWGSSDCRCKGHLLYSPVRPERAEFPKDYL